MPDVYYNQEAFDFGEISPRLHGRTDIQRRRHALSSLVNAIVRLYGTAERRPGTRFVAETKTSAKTSRLIPFEFSDVQAYVIEAGDLYVRFYREGGRIESPPGTPVEVATPYADTDLPSLRWVQSADVLFLVHPSHKPRRLTRTSHTAWTLTPIEFIDGPYLDPNPDTSLTITPSATTGSITLTASSALFDTNHVGALWRLTHGATTGYVEITGFTSSTVVSATVKRTLGGTSATSNWSEGAWSPYRGWPRTVTIFDERMAFGGSTNNPQTVWLSKTADWSNFTPGSAAADPITATIAANKVNVIRWLLASRALLVGTLGEEVEVFSTSGPLAPTSIYIRPHSGYGAANVPPAVVGSTPVFLQRSGKKIRALTFEQDFDQYRSPDLTVAAEHLFRSSAVAEMAYSDEPTPILWAVRADGVLLGFSYQQQDILTVAAWHQHTTGPPTKGKFESVAVIPHPSAGRGQVWTVVNRTIGGATKRYVEVFEETEGYYSFFHVDSGLQYSGAPTDTVSGLGHLEGETVAIVGDGAVNPSQVVASGSVSLQAAASVIEVGLPYTTTITTVRPEVSSDAGSAQGRRKRWSKVFAWVVETLGGVIQGDPQEYRSSATPMDSPPPLFSGAREANVTGWDRDGTLTVQQTQPLPLELVALCGVLTIEGA